MVNDLPNERYAANNVRHMMISMKMDQE